MATFTNQAKNTATLSNPNKYDIAKWADADVTWDDALYSWDSRGIVVTNTTKNTATITNQIKN